MTFMGNVGHVNLFKGFDPVDVADIRKLVNDIHWAY